MSRVLLISTYELGAQPLGLASIAGSLRSAGHEVRATDLAIESFDGVDLDWPDAVGFSVPMHTALRLALGGALTSRAATKGSTGVFLRPLRGGGAHLGRCDCWGPLRRR